jgi:hypothetical protein
MLIPWVSRQKLSKKSKHFFDSGQYYDYAVLFLEGCGALLPQFERPLSSVSMTGSEYLGRRLRVGLSRSRDRLRAATCSQ